MIASVSSTSHHGYQLTKITSSSSSSLYECRRPTDLSNGVSDYFTLVDDGGETEDLCDKNEDGGIGY